MLDRVIVSILALLGLVASAGFMLFFIAGLGENNLFFDNILAQIYSDFNLRWGIVIGGIICFFLNMHLFRLAWRSEDPRLNSVAYETEIGDIQVSLHAVKEVALKAGYKVKGVRELYVSVKHNYKEESTVSLKLSVVVDGERPIKELTEQLQENVKESVERICGIKILNASVYVTKTERVDPAKQSKQSLFFKAHKKSS